MIPYNPTNPLIAIHIPKAAGTSLRTLFEQWFGTGLLHHYFDEVMGTMPPRRDLNSLHTPENPVCLFGHFNYLRGFGIEEYYPDVRQFVTVLRDPFELSVSHYFFSRRQADHWKDKSRIPSGDLAKHLRLTKPNMLNHFPKPVTIHNYRDIIEEFFIEIGVTEYLEESLIRIGAKLSKTIPSAPPSRLNETPRDQSFTAKLREEFMENNRLEFEVYSYALSRYETP